MNIIKKLVPNYAIGRNGYSPKAIVIHIGVGSKEAIYSEFMNNFKSSHYCCNKDGTIWQFVKEEDCAWHAGVVNNPIAEILKEYPFINPNLITIGIENEGIDDISELQYQLNAELIEDISSRHNIPLDEKHIIPHRAINSLKICPSKISVIKIIEMAKRIRDKEQIEIKQLTLLEQLIEKLKEWVVALKKLIK